MSTPESTLTQTSGAETSRRALLAAGVGVAAGLLLEACTGGAGNPAATGSEAPHHDASPSASAAATPEAKRGSEFGDTMVFVDMPATAEAARNQADGVAAQLRAIAASGRKPFVVMEPNSVDLHNVSADPFKALFAALKENNIDHKTIGTWAPFPEANIPQWGEDKTTDPDLFRRNFGTFSDALKGAFPEARTSVLLNSTSYLNGDWGNPSKAASALLPYVQGTGADELCFQGFPWCNDTTDPAKFANPEVAITVAASMGGPGKVGVRLNTGTYSQQTNPDTGAIDRMTDDQRAATLEGELQTAKALKQAGYDTTLQVFAQNKFPAEADWSYPAGSQINQTLNNVLDEATAAGINTAVFQG
ncbi:MAG TPA: hypothetical protein VLF71_04935 [Candidatus Saccharimonadales bacterium]|nr:hypothetical protein [Candidatus Saccharimonadales bacterium]